MLSDEKRKFFCVIYISLVYLTISLILNRMQAISYTYREMMSYHHSNDSVADLEEANSTCLQKWTVQYKFLEHPHYCLLFLLFLALSNILTRVLRCVRASMQDMNININHILNMYIVESINAAVSFLVR